MTPLRSSLAAVLLVGGVLVIVLALRSGEGDTAGSTSGSTPWPTLAGPGGSASVGASTAEGAAPARALDPGLVAAYGRARAAAGEAGHDLVINSGYRTPERQQELLDEEIAKRGSFEEATRWVFTPDRSMHVQGLAIDVGDRDAAAWLEDHGGSYGLCHTLSWEWWHFEWRARWQDAQACPAEAQDPSEAPGR